MRITALDCLHADAGHRNFDFLKVTTDAGLVGWSEYNESFAIKRGVCDQSTKPLRELDSCRAQS